MRLGAARQLEICIWLWHTKSLTAVGPFLPQTQASTDWKSIFDWGSVLWSHGWKYKNTVFCPPRVESEDVELCESEGPTAFVEKKNPH